MRLLFLSHTHAFGDFRVGSHHLARELARRGHEVVHYSTPVSLAHRLLGRGTHGGSEERPRRPVVDALGVVHLAPDVVAPAGIVAPRIIEHLRRTGLPTHYDVLLIDQPLLWTHRLHRLADRVVYRPTDLYPIGRKSMLQARIAAHADAVVATSRPVLESLGPLRVPSIVLENGVEFDHFPEPTGSPRERVAIYVGAFDDRFDLESVSSWARAIPDGEFLLVGPGAPRASTVPSNVRLVGPVAYERLPQLLSSARVGLLPLSRSPLNDGRSPMKLYEYLAAGLTVVSRTTPSLIHEPAIGLLTYATPEEAIPLVRAGLDAPPNAPGRARAAIMSWQARASALDDVLMSLRARERRAR